MTVFVENIVAVEVGGQKKEGLTDNRVHYPAEMHI